jgi:DNA-binding IclR family transcriptional regulator
MDAKDPREITRAGRSLKSVNISWEILHTIASTDGATAADIRNELGYSKSTVHEHLKALIANRAIIRYTEHNPTYIDGPEGYPVYELSFRFFEMGMQTKQQFCPTAVIERELQRLAAETGELARFAIPEYKRVVHVDEAHGHRAIDLGTRLGARDPFPLTAFGRAILSEYADEDVRDEGLLWNVPDECRIDSPEDVYEAVVETRERGYALDDEEFRSGVRTVAVPVTIDGRVIGAVGLSGPASRFHEAALGNDLVVRVESAAETIMVEGSA